MYIQIINKSAAEWTAENAILPENVLGREFDLDAGSQVGTLKVKLGDGVTAWTSLPYLDPMALGQTGAAILVSLGVNATASELNQAADVSAYQESIIAAGALSVTKIYSGLAVVGGGAVTLAAPAASMLGKVKVIEMVTDDGDVTLVLTNVVGQSSGTTATFNDAGDQLVLIAAASKWIVLKERGIALS